MNRFFGFLLPALLLISLLPAEAGTRYEGSVGKWSAVFDITFQSDDEVTGTYSYPKRPGTTYRLSGHNRTAGKLYLEEYTGRELSARCYLEKRLSETHIIWEGEMRNTDGRVLPMVMKRSRAASMPKPKVEVPEFFSRIPQQTRWGEPPRANVAVDMATAHYGEGYANAEVVDCRSDGSSTTVAFQLGVFVPGETRDVFESTGPTVSVSFPRALPQGGGWLKGHRIDLEVTEEGEILSLNLAQVAVTHYRKVDSGKLEVRAWVEPPGITEFTDLQNTETYATKIEFVPDKIALPGILTPEEAKVMSFQTLRVTEEFGIAVQVLDAGPAILELESISLDEPADEVPWIPIGTGNAWEATPLTQRTGQGG